MCFAFRPINKRERAETCYTSKASSPRNRMARKHFIMIDSGESEKEEDATLSTKILVSPLAPQQQCRFGINLLSRRLDIEKRY